ncbi:MAG: purine-binding chemotaxis protein CheW [Nitrospirae bacterium]|nr:purine-binding chemotaxis protein CheW [Nitrospirota bacterium]
MDIAKIRKKALAGGRQPETEKTPSTENGPVATGAGDPEVLPDPTEGPENADAAHLTEEAAGPADGPSAAENPVAASPDSGPRATELLTFSLDREEFAFRVPEVEEIIRFQRITRVPTVPDYVLGITSLRGKIIPVIDLRARLALDRRSSSGPDKSGLAGDGVTERKEKIIILSGPKGLIGAIIDRVMGVVRLTEDIILEPPPHLTEEETRFIEGVVIVDKRFISIVRAEDAMDIELE